jgi:hypothetical protein
MAGPGRRPRGNRYVVRRLLSGQEHRQLWCGPSVVTASCWILPSLTNSSVPYLADVLIVP